MPPLPLRPPCPHPSWPPGLQASSSCKLPGPGYLTHTYTCMHVITRAHTHTHTCAAPPPSPPSLPPLPRPPSLHPPLASPSFDPTQRGHTLTSTYPAPPPSRSLAAYILWILITQACILLHIMIQHCRGKWGASGTRTPQSLPLCVDPGGPTLCVDPGGPALCVDPGGPALCVDSGGPALCVDPGGPAGPLSLSEQAVGPGGQAVSAGTGALLPAALPSQPRPSPSPLPSTNCCSTPTGYSHPHGYPPLTGMTVAESESGSGSISRQQQLQAVAVAEAGSSNTSQQQQQQERWPEHIELPIYQPSPLDLAPPPPDQLQPLTRGVVAAGGAAAAAPALDAENQQGGGEAGTADAAFGDSVTKAKCAPPPERPHPPAPHRYDSVTGSMGPWGQAGLLNLVLLGNDRVWG